jgi:hypothetical protein
MEDVTPEVNNISAQPQTSQPPVGQSEDINALKAEYERKTQGLINDLRQEREKRQQYEAALRTPTPAAPAVANEVDQALAQSDRLRKMEADLAAERRAREEERVYKFIAKQEKMDPDDVPNSLVFKELLRVAEESGVRGNSMEHEARIAYELLQKRRAEKVAQAQNAEVQRTDAINSQAPEAARGVQTPSAGVKRVSAAEVGRMSVEQFQALQADAQKHGYEIQYYKD